MLKMIIYLALLLVCASCGKKSPVIAGVDLPPDNNTPVGAPVQNSTPGTNTALNPDPNQNAEPQPTPDPVAKVFDAPLVLVRGTVEQQQTAMNTAPGT
jgi:predicted small lipoprotein YifL